MPTWSRGGGRRRGPSVVPGAYDNPILLERGVRAERGCREGQEGLCYLEMIRPTSPAGAPLALVFAG
eukprot:623895-Pleurochrysis_carterae.AAC.1